MMKRLTTAGKTRASGLILTAGLLLLFAGPALAIDWTDFGGTITASSEIGSAEGASKAFDNDTNTKWLTANNDPAGRTGWLQFQFPGGQQHVIDSITIIDDNDWPTRNPVNWQLLGSNTGAFAGEEAVLDTQTSVTWQGAAFQIKKFHFTNALAFEYIRLNVTANNGAVNLMGFSELQLIERDAIDRTDAAGIVTASSEIGAAEAAWMAFDTNSTTKWLTANNDPAGRTGWITYQFPGAAAYAITGYSITSANDSPTRSPRDWTLEGSHDGASWTPLDTRTEQRFTNNWQERNYRFINTIAYEYYRLNVTANNGSANLMGFCEMELLEYPALIVMTAPTVTDLNLGQTIDISALAAGLDGRTIDRVDFYVNGTLVGTDNTPVSNIYTTQWTVPTPGAYTLSAVATDSLSRTWTDSLDASARDPRAIVVDTILDGSPPEGGGANVVANFFDFNLSTIFVSETPAEGVDTFADVDFGQVVTIAEVFHRDRDSMPNDRVAGFDLIFSDNATFGDADDRPVSFTRGNPGDDASLWVLREEQDQTYTLPPDSTGRYLRWDVTDHWNTTYQGLGGYELQFFRPSAGDIAITAPAADTWASLGNNLTLTANAIPATGAVTQVQFFDGLLLAGTSTTNDGAGNFSVNWSPGAPGFHQITALATTDLGGLFYSTAVTVNVPIFAKPAPTNAGTGFSWADATDLSGAIAYGNNSVGGAPVMCSSGAYTLTANIPDLQKRFSFYGSCVGTEISPTERGATFLADSPTTIAGGGVYSGFFSGRKTAFTFDGLVMLDTIGYWGSAISMNGIATNPTLNVTVANCAFDGNSATDRAGAIFFRHANSVTVHQCTFSNNLSPDGDGAGVEVLDSGAGTVIDSTFEGNIVSGAAAGLHIQNTRVGTVRGCTFRNNQANGDGGGMRLNGTNTYEVSGCVFDDNFTTIAGGGLALWQAGIGTIHNCTFNNNVSGGRGGGLADYRTDLTLTDCTFTGNAAGTDGGAVMADMWNESTNPVAIEGCRFDGNTAANEAGAVFPLNGWGQISNCVFVNNRCGVLGGAMRVWNSHCVIINNTFYGNNDTGGAIDGIAKGDARDMRVINCLFAGHDDAAIDAQGAGQVIIDACLLENAPADNFIAGTPTSSNNLLTDPPGFIGVGVGNVDLRNDSAAVDGGVLFNHVLPDVNLPVSTPERDIVDRYRGDSQPDLGAYELATSRLALQPSPVAFGTVVEGSAGIVTVNVLSVGSLPVVVTGATLTGPEFAITADSIGTSVTVTPDAPATIEVTFTPPVTGFRTDYTDVLAVTSNADGSPTTAALEATGAATVLPGGNAAVTVNQANGQADPTGSFPVIFDVVFSEGVTGLALDDIVWEGDYWGTSITATLRSVDPAGAAYQLLVSGVTGPTTGTLTPTVRELAVRTAAGNGNTTSTATDNSVLLDTGLLGAAIATADGPVTDANTIAYTITFSADATGTTGALTEAGLTALLSLEGTAANATISAVTETVAARTFLVEITTGNVDGTLTLVLADDDSIVDAATGLLSLNGAGTGEIRGPAVLIDKTAPVLLSITRDVPTSQAITTDEEFVVFRLTFDDAVTGLILADVTSALTDSPVTIVYGVGNNWYAFCTVGAIPGTLELTVSSGATVINAAGAAWNGAAPAVNESYVVEEPGTVNTAAQRRWMLLE